MNKIILAAIVLSGLYLSCSPAEGNKPGREYMPDMAHSVAYEANSQQYYSLHHWNGIEDYRQYAIPRLPVKGSIARGSIRVNYTDSASNTGAQMMICGDLSNNAMPYRGNGHLNYYYNDTEEERLRASREITSNPLPLTAKALESGKSNYLIYCSICHGEKGDGGGYLVRDDGGKYPAQPANFLKDDFIAASEGRFYHAVMYGKNVMGSYANKLSFTERWEVLHYIRALQAASKNLKYSPTENTFTNSQAVLDAKKASASVAAVAASPSIKK